MQIVKDEFGDISDLIEKVRDKNDSHNTKSVENSGKLFNKINLLYVGVGSIVIALIYMIIQLIDKFEHIHNIAEKMGV
jgi:hypothetical protein